jgi:hypothetical protein
MISVVFQGRLRVYIRRGSTVSKHVLQSTISELTQPCIKNVIVAHYACRGNDADAAFVHY